MTTAADAAAYVDEWKAHRATTAVHGTSFSKVVGGFFLHTLGFQGHAQEFHTAVMSVQQLQTDYFRCGRPPTLVSPSVAVQDAAAAPAAAALDRIHHVLLVRDACPTRVPPEYECGLATTRRHFSNVTVWVLHPTRECPSAAPGLRALRPDPRTTLGAWYQTHRRALWEVPRTGISNFARLYVLRHHGGGTYLDLDMLVTQPHVLRRLPECIFAQAQDARPDRFATSMLRLHSQHPLLLELERDWINAWDHLAQDGAHRYLWGYVGVLSLSRAVDVLRRGQFPQCAPSPIVFLGGPTVVRDFPPLVERGVPSSSFDASDTLLLKVHPSPRLASLCPVSECCALE